MLQLLGPILLTPLGTRYMKHMSLAEAEWENTAACFCFTLPMTVSHGGIKTKKIIYE